MKSETLRANPYMLHLAMTFADFQHLARLSVVGALEIDELGDFREGLRAFGSRAEEYLHECRRLESALTLGLCPAPVRANAKERLLAAIGGRGKL